MFFLNALVVRSSRGHKMIKIKIQNGPCISGFNGVERQNIPVVPVCKALDPISYSTVAVYRSHMTMMVMYISKE